MDEGFGIKIVVYKCIPKVKDLLIVARPLNATP
jgi:hypothetical protein